METNNGNKLQQKKQKWFLLLISSLLFSTLLVLITITSCSTTQLLYLHKHRRKHEIEVPHFVESKLKLAKPRQAQGTNRPRLAYLISGSAGDGVSVKRTLKAVYHPWNHYAVHLDLEATAEERLELVRWVGEERVFKEVGNVRVVVRSNLVTYRGPTMVSNTLHAAAILLRDAAHWDWFINLSASDYPLLTQDGMYVGHSFLSSPLSLLLLLLLLLSLK